MMSVTTLFLDLDAYFASAEQHLRPELRGRPVGVAPVMAGTSCCIAVSYEARSFGVRTGTLVREARRLCPQIVIVHARPAAYVRLHHRVLDAAQTCLPIDKVYSIDEFACRLLGAERDAVAAAEIGMAMKRALRERIGPSVTCSIGIGPNRLIAKVAGAMRKPDGLVVVEPQMIPKALLELALDDWTGIGRGMLARFRSASVETTEQMYALSEDEMARVFGGIEGSRWWRMIRGFDLPDKQTVRRTLGHEHVLPPELRSRDGARGVMVRLVCKAAQRLRHEGCRAGALMTVVRFEHGGRWRRRTLLPPTSSTRVLLETFDQQWSQAPDGRFLVVGVTLLRLAHDGFAPSPLFADEAADERLDAAVDRLTKRYGYDAVRPASMCVEAAPMRISFGVVPDLQLPDRTEDDGDSV